jgi:hypothetical protein
MGMRIAERVEDRSWIIRIRASRRGMRIRMTIWSLIGMSLGSFFLRVVSLEQVRIVLGKSDIID